MSETKFTPGPWGRDKWGHIVDADGEHIRCGGVSLAHRVTEEVEANDYLIAAAPDLYAVAAAMVADDAFAELCAGIGEEPDWLKKARVALAKARGEEPKP